MYHFHRTGFFKNPFEKTRPVPSRIPSRGTGRDTGSLQPCSVGQVLIEIESSSNPEQPGLSSSILSKLCAYEPNLHFFATIICRHYLQLGIGDKGGAEAIIHAANDCYRRPSNLFFGDDRIHSSSGAQQGDPLASLKLLSILSKMAKNGQKIAQK